MKISADDIYKSVGKIRAVNPLIHNITNYVAMNNTANALLAIGASPVMAHAAEEVKEMTTLAQALVIAVAAADAVAFIGNHQTPAIVLKLDRTS